ncbi:MAG: GntR family transcriptional regulator [Emergencia sp.]
MAGKVERKSLVDQVYDLILEKIQLRELVPGDRLNIEELAREFGVSRTPVRETINRLIQEGFVEQMHNVGPRIIQLDEEQELNLIEANASLFNIVIDSFSRMDSMDNLVEDLQEMLSAQIAADQSGEDSRFHAAAVGFHKVIIEYCSNPIIRDYTLKTQNQINMCTFSYMTTMENRKESISAHTNIKNALQEGNIEQAKELMESHNRFAGTVYFRERERE